jgi:hypothetical protein
MASLAVMVKIVMGSSNGIPTSPGQNHQPWLVGKSTIEFDEFREQNLGFPSHD